MRENVHLYRYKSLLVSMSAVSASGKINGHARNFACHT